MDLDDETALPSNRSALIPSKDYVAPLPPVTSALDPRLQVSF